jgi:hypothetical protein
MFLTDQELKDLTGYERPKAVRKWLDENGYRYDVAQTGWPRVLRDAVCARLGQPSKREPRLNLG